MTIRTKLLTLLCFSILALLGSCNFQRTANDGVGVSAKVISVGDGDSFKVQINGRERKVRLHAVDCPELLQDFGKKARRFTNDKIYNKSIRLKIVETDKYERLVSKVILNSGESLNELLIKEGLCWWYRRYAPHDKTLEHLENEARRELKGLWKSKNPSPPWIWRQHNRRLSK